MCGPVCHAGKQKVKDFNIYVHPFIDELKKLWEFGAMVKDVSIADQERQKYVIRTVLMWTTHDYPGYGMTSSLQNQGIYACPPCGPDEVPAYSTKILSKVIYHGHRKFLKKDHMWRARHHNNKFNGQDEASVEPPKWWTGWDWLCQWEKVDEGRLDVGSSGMKGLSSFYELEYWAVSSSYQLYAMLGPLHMHAFTV